MSCILSSLPDTAATAAESELVMPTAASVGNEIVTKHLNKALGDTKQYDWAALQQESDWLNRHTKRTKSIYKNISEITATEWANEITAALESRMKEYFAAIQARGAASTSASPAPGMGGGAKAPPRATRSLSTMLREGAKLMKTYESNKLDDPADQKRVSSLTMLAAPLALRSHMRAFQPIARAQSFFLLVWHLSQITCYSSACS